MAEETPFIVSPTTAVETFILYEEFPEIKTFYANIQEKLPYNYNIISDRKPELLARLYSTFAAALIADGALKGDAANLETLEAIKGRWTSTEANFQQPAAKARRFRIAGKQAHLLANSVSEHDNTETYYSTHMMGRRLSARGAMEAINISKSLVGQMTSIPDALNGEEECAVEVVVMAKIIKSNN